MAKILILSDSPTVATGYGRVIKELSMAFHKAGLELKLVGRGYNGEKHDFPFEILGHTPNDRFAIEPLKRAISEWQPDILFTLGDIWMLDFVPSLQHRNTFKWVCYFPFDGVPIPLKWHSTIKDVDYPVMFSKFSLDLVKEVTDKPVELIYHGVDIENFHRLPDRDQVRKASNFHDKFIVGCVARNQPRKNLPALIRTFKKFSEGKDDVGLYLHTTMNDIGWDLMELLRRFDMVQQTYLTNGMHNAACSVPDATLNKIYNFFDLFALPTMGEGFGLPILEAQSAEVPVLVTNYSACPELVVDPEKQLIDVKNFVVMNHQCIDQAVVDEEDMLRKMEFFYHDWKHNNAEAGKQLGKAGRALAESMTWNKFTGEFVDFMKRVSVEAASMEKKNYSKFMKI